MIINNQTYNIKICNNNKHTQQRKSSGPKSKVTHGGLQKYYSRQVDHQITKWRCLCFQGCLYCGINSVLIFLISAFLEAKDVKKYSNHYEEYSKKKMRGLSPAIEMAD